MRKKIGPVKQLKKSNGCSYPNCSDDSPLKIKLPIGKMTESGLIEFISEGRKTVQTICLLCKYHACFAEKRLINLINQQGLIRLIGSFELIELMEKIIEVKELHKIKNDKKNKK